MFRLLILMAVFFHSAFLFSGDLKGEKYENHVYFFTMDLPKNSEKKLTIVKPIPPQPSHGFAVEIEGEHRSIVVYAGYNATYQENSIESFKEWLNLGSSMSLKALSIGNYSAFGLMGFRVISIQSAEVKNPIIVESIRILRNSKDGKTPGIWYEFRLNTDAKHYINDSNLFNRLMFSFRPIKDKCFQ